LPEEVADGHHLPARGGGSHTVVHESDPRAKAPQVRRLRLTSFGYLHLRGDAAGRPVLPAADRIDDVRSLHDPAVAPHLLDLDGTHPHVQAVVLATPGVPELLANLTAYALLPSAPREIAIGCSGGKHRACALVEVLARRVRAGGRDVDVTHLHAALPRTRPQ
jgi:RNase adaptor protein for sRNA GlmZ degradation